VIAGGGKGGGQQWWNVGCCRGDALRSGAEEQLVEWVPLLFLITFWDHRHRLLVFKAGLDNNSGDFNNKNALQIFFLFLHHVRLSLVGVGKPKMTTLGHCKGKKHNYNKVAK
jgi:hypothetical protein